MFNVIILIIKLKINKLYKIKFFFKRLLSGLKQSLIFEFDGNETKISNGFQLKHLKKVIIL